MLDMRDGVCPLCRHNQILEIEATTSGYKGHERRFAACYGEDNVFSTSTPNRGELLLYACRECGHAQWFASDPGTIPIDAPGIRLITGPAPSAGGYR